MDTITDELGTYYVRVGFVTDNKETRSILGRFHVLLQYLYRWTRLDFTKIRFRHVFTCSDGLCFDLNSGGIDYWSMYEMNEELYPHVVWVDFPNFPVPVEGRAFILEEAGTHISRADVIRAYFRLPVKGMFCASFVGRMLGYQVPLDIEPDKLYTLLNAYGTNDGETD